MQTADVRLGKRVHVTCKGSLGKRNIPSLLNCWVEFAEFTMLWDCLRHPEVNNYEWHQWFVPQMVLPARFSGSACSKCFTR